MKLIAKLVVASAFLGTNFVAVAGEAAGYFEPGYVNYNYEVSSRALSISDINGLNQIEPAAANDNHVYEPGYRNYAYSARPGVNPAATFDEQSFKPFYTDFQ